ncbi:MAG: SRPBCC family protein [Desulfosarcinaceae bacterium]|nr:SRPBCC family protein [Desulfosarcinaceae bacterium]
MRIRSQIDIKAPLERVWQVFSRLEGWQEWNTACRDCCYIEGEKMGVDTCFSFKVAPLIFPIEVKPRIVKCEPAKEVVWRGARFGIEAEHLFRFTETDDGVLLLSEEIFRGPLVLLGRLIGVPKRLHALTDQMMLGIKRQSEACGE